MQQIKKSIIRVPQPNDYRIQYYDIFTASEKQKESDNSCILFSVYNASNFIRTKQNNKEDWDKSFKEIADICKNRPEFCREMQELGGPVQECVNNRNEIRSGKEGYCKYIADFFKVINDCVNEDSVKSYYGIAYLVGTFAAAILIDNVKNLIYIRDSHRLHQYIVTNTSDLYAHLLLDKYFANIDKIKNDRPKIQYVMYEDNTTINRNKPVNVLSEKELYEKIYNILLQNPNDENLIYKAAYNKNDDFHLRSRIEQYLNTNNLKIDNMNIFYNGFKDYIIRKMSFQGGSRANQYYKDKYLKYKAKYLLLKRG
jgi:hypothetical protein